MEEPKINEKNEFDRSGQYDSGLQSLVKSLQWAFAFLLVVIVGMLIYFFAAGGYFSVSPQQSVIVLNFGRYLDTYTTGGHWFLPYPVNRIVRVRTNQQSLNVDFLPAEQLEGNAGGQSLEPGRDNYLMTGDANIVHAQWNLNYRVVNPAKYYQTLATPLEPDGDDEVVADGGGGFAGKRGPQTLVVNLFREAVIEVTAELKVDDVLYSNVIYSDEVLRRFTRHMEAIDCGLEVTGVVLMRVFPPVKTKAAFDEVAAAANTSRSLVTQADEYRVKTENEMQASRSEILTQAETYKRNVVSTVKSESSYFEIINKEYAASPRTVLMALYNSTISEVLTAQDGKYILGTAGGLNGRKQLRIKLNPEPRAVNSSSQTKTEGK